MLRILYFWLFDNRLLNSIYGEGTDKRTMIDKMHGIGLSLLYLIAIGLCYYFYDYHQSRTQYLDEWRQRSVENSRLYRESLEKYNKQYLKEDDTSIIKK